MKSTCPGVLIKEVSEAGAGQIMEGFVGQEDRFKWNPLGGGEQMEILKDGSDVFTEV